MLVIDAVRLDIAAEALMVAVMQARTEGGQMIGNLLPQVVVREQAEFGQLTGVRRTTENDTRRIRAIVLAAVVSLTGETCRISDEVHLREFGDFDGSP